MISSVKVAPLKFCKTQFFQICNELDNHPPHAASSVLWRKKFSSTPRAPPPGCQADYIFGKIEFCKTWGAQLLRMISFLWWPILLLQYKQEGRSFFRRRLFIWWFCAVGTPQIDLHMPIVCHTPTSFGIISLFFIWSSNRFSIGRAPPKVDILASFPWGPHNISLLIASEARQIGRASLASQGNGAHVLVYMGKQNNWISRKLRVFEIWSIEAELVWFSTPEPISIMNRPDIYGHWWLISRNLSSVQKKIILHKSWIQGIHFMF